MSSKDGTISEFLGYTSYKEEVEEEDEEEEKEELEKKGSKEASEIGLNSESPGYAAFDNESESDLESTARSKPKSRLDFYIIFYLRDLSFAHLAKVMAAPIISISSDVLVESVGSSILRVILIGSVSMEVPIAPEVGAAAVALPVGVLELDTHSSSEVDPSESSPPHVSVAPMVSPFLGSDDSESDTKIPERHVSHTTSTPEIPTAPILPAPSTIAVTPPN
ncbi:hypothetical protein Tco_0508289 [Tanacetum coccineum]